MLTNSKGGYPTILPFGEGGMLIGNDLQDILRGYNALLMRVRPNGDIELLVPSDDEDNSYVWSVIQDLIFEDTYPVSVEFTDDGPDGSVN